MKRIMALSLVLVLNSSVGFSSDKEDEYMSFTYLGPKVVDELDLNQYLGLWYEVASTKPTFQKDCECVTAEYSLSDEGFVEVKNSCRKGGLDGEDEVAFGKAYPTSEPAKFNVTFGNFRLPFSNYWVVDLAPDYSYAVVSSFFKRPIWILSRTETMDDDLYGQIISSLAEKGFNTSLIKRTIQEGCR